MSVIAIWSRKGGTGKTTLTQALSSCEEMGKNRLIIDFDPQQDLSLICGHPVDGNWHGTVDALTDRGTMQDAMVQLSTGAWLMRGDTDLDVFEHAWTRVGTTMSPELALLRLLEPYRNDFTIIIDCQPGFSLVPRMALAAADYVLSPVLPELMAVHGLRSAIIDLEKIRSGNPRYNIPALNPNIRFLGAVFSRVSGRNASHKTRMQLNAQRFCRENGLRIFDTIIPDRIGVQEAQAAGQTTSEVGPAEVAAIHHRLAREITQALKSEEKSHGQI